MPVVVTHGPDGLPPPPPITPPPPTSPPPIASPPSQTPDLPRSNERFITVNAAGGTVPVLYGGPYRVGGYIVFAKEAGGFLYIDFVVSEGPIEEIASIEIDGKPIAEVAAAHNIHLGNAGDTTDALMVAADADYVSPEFVAHVAVKFNPPSESTGNFDPTRFECIAKGRKLFDTRTSTTAWSTNPVLEAHDAITNDRYGFGEGSANIDTTTFNQAANDCDVDIDPGAGTIKRWEASLRIDREMDGDEALTLIRSHCGAIITPPGDKWKCVLDVARASTGITLIDNGDGRNCARPIVDTKDVSEIPTVVIVEWTDAAHDYVDKTVQYPDPFPANTEWREARYTLRGITTIERARRAARYLYKRLRKDTRLTALAWETALRLEPGDRFSLNSRRLKSDGSSEECTVSEIRTGSLGHTVFAELYDVDIFSDAVDTTGADVAPPPPQTPLSPPPAPVGVDAIEVVTTGSNGFAISRLKLTWTPASTPFYRGTRITMDVAGGDSGVLIGEFANGPVYVENPKLGAVHTFYFKTISTGGVPSSASTTAETPLGGTPSSGVTSLTFDSSRDDESHKRDRSDSTALRRHYDSRVAGSFIGIADVNARRYVSRVYLYDGTGTLPSAASWADGAANERYVLATDAVINGKTRFLFDSSYWEEVVETFSPDQGSTDFISISGTQKGYRLMVRAEGYNGGLGPEVAVHTNTAGPFSTAGTGNADPYVKAQASSPGTAQSGKHSNISGVGIFGTEINVGQNAPQSVVAGRRYVSVKGSSDVGAVEMSQGSADADAASVGVVQFTDTNSTAASEKRIAAIRANLEGATSTKRGGKLHFFTKANNTDALTERMVITENGRVGVGDSDPGISQLLVESQDAARAAISVRAAASPTEAIVRVQDSTGTVLSKIDKGGSLQTVEASRIAPWIEPEVIASATTTINSTTATDITGATVTFTPKSDCRAQVTAFFDLEMTTAGSVFVGELVVAGTPRAQQMIYGPKTLNDRATIGQVWNFTLTGGTSYTIKLTGRLAAGAGVFSVNLTHTKFSLIGIGRF